jgi:transcription-repair coupling factor (superfamily II helicase)
VLVVTPVESVIRSIPEKSFFLNKGFALKEGEEYPFDDLIDLLVSYGYSREYRVESAGQFSVKGGIIDVFSSALENPLRIDFFGYALESIREFDINTQVSHTRHKEVMLFPRKEIILSKSEMDRMLKALRDASAKGLHIPPVPEEGGAQGENFIEGIEDLFPLIMGAETLPAFLRKDARIIFAETTELIAQKEMLEKTFRSSTAKNQNSRLPSRLKRS